MAVITLTRGAVALVDDALFSHLNQWKWTYDGRYAYRKVNRANVYMHQVVAKTPKGYDTDHLNRDKLDNRLENLRATTRSLNKFNVGLIATNTSGMKGVRWDASRGKWFAFITIMRKMYNLGRFDNVEEALDARKRAESKLGVL